MLIGTVAKMFAIFPSANTPSLGKGLTGVSTHPTVSHGTLDFLSCLALEGNNIGDEDPHISYHVHT